MKKDSTTMVTRQDILRLQTAIDANTTDIAAIREEMATKQDIAAIREEMITKKDWEKMRIELKDELKNELFEGIRVLNENLLYDFKGAFSDRTEVLKDTANNHGRRIVRIERFLHLLPEA